MAPHSKFIGLWDPASGHETQRLSGGFDSACSVAFSPDGALLAAGTSSGTVLWDLSTGRELPTLLGSSERSFIAFSRDGKVASGGGGDTIALWNVGGGQRLQVLTGHSGGVTGAAFSTDGRTLFSSGNDGAVRIWDVASGRERASLIAFDDGSWIAVTPAGFFASSDARAEERLNVRVGDRVFGISSFRDTFYRPDLVRRALAGEDMSRYGDIANVKLSPQIDLADLPATTGEQTLKINVKLTDGGGGIGSVRVFTQGTVILQDDSKGGLNRSYTIPLSSGDNQVRVAASNVEGTMWSMVDGSVTSTHPAAANDNAPRGVLHAIVVGINTFPKSLGADLTLAVPDAQVFAETLAARAKPLFKSLDIVPLITPQQTDRASIESAIRAMQKTVGPNDAFVFYVASHGMVGNNGEYYILTSNVSAVTQDALEHDGISRRELTDLLANIGTTHKIVFIDTCDSRGFAGESQQAVPLDGMDPKIAATIISRQVGLTMLMAAQTRQTAFAGYPPTAAAKDQHGLFTYALKDGLDGKAVDPATGLVTSDKLAAYVDASVPAMAKTLNPPQHQQPNDSRAGQAFPIAKAK